MATDNLTTNIGITIPEGSRAVLVSMALDGGMETTLVAQDESVLNIQRDLISHLSAQPFDDDWLLELRNYIDARLEARGLALKMGGVAIPRDRQWVVTQMSTPFQPMEGASDE